MTAHKSFALQPWSSRQSFLVAFASVTYQESSIIVTDKIGTAQRQRRLMRGIFSLSRLLMNDGCNPAPIFQPS
jgi:hypothetical protein